MSSSVKARREAAKAIAKAGKLVAFSGAGVSAESDISTFRDAGGIWDRFDPEELGTSDGLMGMVVRKPAEVAAFLMETLRAIVDAKPNRGHMVLAELERMKILRSVITQNVDDLHSEAGNTRVIEVHGNLLRLKCLSCGGSFKLAKPDYEREMLRVIGSIKHPLDLSGLIGSLPKCPSCSNPCRPDVVMFGESVQQMDIAFEEAKSCDVMLVMGTSGVVYPAAMLPRHAKAAGSIVIDMNPDGSAFADIADFELIGRTGEIMPLLLEEIRMERNG
jgi:NAD-dependent deacetylase